ncbi:MAG: flagellar biosynthetic protein FliR [Firmicutes bacterium]|nr:flagellar biosynthetic protein FliR [Bacillota bacterium]
MVNFSFSIYDLEYFLLILVRITAFVHAAPFFSLRNTPVRVRVGISFFTAMLLYQALTPSEYVEYSTLLEYAVIVMKEAVVGLLIGFGASICISIVNFAGSIADMEIGLSMMTLMDPATLQNTSITGVFYQYVLMLLMVATGMYRYLFAALADTFTLIPVNGAIFHGDKLVDAMLQFLGDYVIIGFRIILPIFCTILLLNAILGVLAKVAPQMNMFAVGMQLKILVGLSILFLTANMLSGVADFVFQEMKYVMNSFVGALQ